MTEPQDWLKDPLWPHFGPGIGSPTDPLDPGRMAARAAAQQVLDAARKASPPLDVERLTEALWAYHYATEEGPWEHATADQRDHATGMAEWLLGYPHEPAALDPTPSERPAADIGTAWEGTRRP